MKPTLINNGLEPPEKRELDREEFEAKALEYVKKNYTVTEVYDLYDHDRWIALSFTEWKERNKYEKHANGYYHNEPVEAGKQTFFSLSELWEIYCKQ